MINGQLLERAECLARFGEEREQFEHLCNFLSSFEGHEKEEWDKEQNRQISSLEHEFLLCPNSPHRKHCLVDLAGSSLHLL